MIPISMIWVALGGAVGSVLRYGLALLLFSPASDFPRQTLLVNVLGSLLLGFLFQMLERQSLTHTAYLLLAVGFCGGFTTLSAISLETLQMLKQQQYSMATLYVAATLILGVVAAAAGYYISKQI